MPLVAGLAIGGSRQRLFYSTCASIVMRNRIYDSAEDLQGLGHEGCKTAKVNRTSRSGAPFVKRSRYISRSLAKEDLDAKSYCANDRTLDRITQRLVAMSTLPFLVLFLPQFLKNAQFIASGNPSALTSLSWLSYLTGIGGNTLLLTYFTQKRETSAVFVQAIGIASAFAVLTQMRIAQCIPRSIYLGTAIMVATTAILTGLKLAGWLERSKLGQQLWTVWQKALGFAGLFSVPQVLCATVGIDPWIPTLLATGLGSALAIGESAGVLPLMLREVWGRVSAWTATCLFMLQPVAQLIRSFSTPGGLDSLSLATISFAATGNALMVPRAFFTGDVIWSVGCLWGSLVFGWGQMLSLYLGRTIGGERIMGYQAFGVATILLWGWLAGAALVCLKQRKQTRVKNV